MGRPGLRTQPLFADDWRVGTGSLSSRLPWHAWSSARRRFVGILCLVFLGAVAWSVVPFRITVDDASATKRCTAVLDGWRIEKTAPSNAAWIAYVRRQQMEWDQVDEALASLRPSHPSKATVRELVEQDHAWANQPWARSITAWVDWATGPGECVPQARRRLEQSGAVVGAAALVGGVALAVSRRRSRSRDRARG